MERHPANFDTRPMCWDCGCLDPLFVYPDEPVPEGLLAVGCGMCDNEWLVDAKTGERKMAPPGPSSRISPLGL
jgi:hypothetical protein